MDNAGTIRVSDYGIAAYLPHTFSVTKKDEQDLPALGSLIESLSQTPYADMKDFIEKCKSPQSLCSELLDHPFLQLHGTAAAADRLLMLAVEPVAPINSRLDTEFEKLDQLGHGAFGDVLKVRKVFDNREYAIKRIPIKLNLNETYKKMKREVELLSNLNNENVVRYYSSWMEFRNLEDEPANNDSSDDDELSNKSYR